MKPCEFKCRGCNYETGVHNRLSLSSVCNCLQEAAGEQVIEGVTA